ncbi:MAG: hypothetical protein CL888_00040 [Dehalococcoidia bacterium]|nr:hypothetical protein [Dehalococcoidia bacterium]MEC8048834.1 hypothetical protein [Chloroflexota bacterium]|tara:strand:- start:1507 stop:2238 length:732 start_codon:yes stop_codon:yes gene_type:complete
MNKFAVKIFPIIISILLIFSFSCSNKSGNDKSEINKLEYHGFIFHEGKVSVFLKNYSKENYLITLNSLSPEEEIKEKEISELIFLNSSNKNSSLKIKNIINVEEKIISKSLINPELNYKKVNINEDFKIKINETVYEKSTNTIMRLIDISEDSRCPDPTDNNESISNPGSCIHNPKTLIHLMIETARFNLFDEFIYKEQLKDYEFFYGGNYIKISKIDPDILELNRFIEDSDYEITISISQNN